MKIRHCAWTDEGQAVDKKVIWARGRVIATQCPKSLISNDSLAFLELFDNWQSMGGGSLFAIDAKSADAIRLLQQEWNTETQNET